MIPKQHYRDDVDLSIIGFGGIIVVGMEQSDANSLVTDVVNRGINYFDVAPQYGDGEAEIKLGNALKPHRDNVFLACKTLRRDADGAREELERSLDRLHTDHFDLYQFHSVSKTQDVEEIFRPGGAIETFVEAREDGLVNYLGFSSHLEEAALDMMDRFDFDSILFPTNFVCWYHGNFGPRVFKKAKEQGVSRLGLKSLALRPWNETEEKTYPNCWYHPIEDRELARKAMQFTLSRDVTALVPPGDHRLFKLALDLAHENLLDEKINLEELSKLSLKYEPLFRNEN